MASPSFLIGTALAIGWLCGVQGQIFNTNHPVVQTFAGSGFRGYQDGVGQQAMFSSPSSILADAGGNLFVVDYGNACVRKITTNGIVTTFVGGGNSSLPGFGTNVSLPSLIQSITFDSQGTMYGVGAGAGIFRIYPNGYVERFQIPGYYQSPPPYGLCVDSLDNVYMSEPDSNRIMVYLKTGELTVFAGSPQGGFADGVGEFSKMNRPTSLAVDQANNVYFWDSGNYVIRRVNPAREVSTLTGRRSGANIDGVGASASFGSCGSMAVDHQGNILVAGGGWVRLISASTNVSTLAGSFASTGFANGAGNLARFDGAFGACLSQGTVFVAEQTGRIRRIDFDPQPQIVTGADLEIATFAGVKLNGIVGRTYRVESSLNNTVWVERATFLLTETPSLWLDRSPISGHRFYRAILLP